MIYSIDYAERKIETENLRMQLGGTIFSKLHNYEMYDAMLSKLAIMLDVSKEYFVSINFLYKDNKGLKLLEDKYNQSLKKYNFPYSFDDIMFVLDYIYCVDLMAYINNPDKEVILSGAETEDQYEIHPNVGEKLSLDEQKRLIYDFDRFNFLALLDNHGDCASFSKYIVDNQLRLTISRIVELLDQSVDKKF